MPNSTEQQDSLLTHAMQAFNARDYAAEAEAMHAQAIKNQTAADVCLFGRLNVSPVESKKVTLARTVLVPWLESLPLARLQHPFYMAELRSVVRQSLTAAGIKHSSFTGATIAHVLYELGFARAREHGSTRPQTRFWLHPAAQAAQSNKRARAK